MSIGSLGGLTASVAGSPLAQTRGSEAERSQQDAAVQQRQAAGDRKAQSAAGIGETDGQDHEASDRDADGRRLWERPGGSKSSAPPPADPPRGKDATGQAGTQLDLSG